MTAVLACVVLVGATAHAKKIEFSVGEAVEFEKFGETLRGEVVEILATGWIRVEYSWAGGATWTIGPPENFASHREQRRAPTGPSRRNVKKAAAEVTVIGPKRTTPSRGAQLEEDPKGKGKVIFLQPSTTTVNSSTDVVRFLEPGRFVSVSIRGSFPRSVSEEVRQGIVDALQQHGSLIASKAKTTIVASLEIHEKTTVHYIGVGSATCRPVTSKLIVERDGEPVWSIGTYDPPSMISLQITGDRRDTAQKIVDRCCTPSAGFFIRHLPLTPEIAAWGKTTPSRSK